MTLGGRACLHFPVASLEFGQQRLSSSYSCWRDGWSQHDASQRTDCLTPAAVQESIIPTCRELGIGELTAPPARPSPSVLF